MNTFLHQLRLAIRFAFRVTALVSSVAALVFAFAAVIYASAKFSMAPTPRLGLAETIVAIVVVVLGALAFAFFSLLRCIDRQRAATTHVVDQFSALLSEHYRSARAISCAAPSAPAGTPDAAPGAADTVRAQAPAPADAPDTTDTTDTTGAPAVPRVTIARAVLGTVHDYVSNFLREHGSELEAGGIFVGEFTNDAEQGCTEILVNGFIDGGPNVKATVGSIDFDLPYINRQLRALRMQHPRLEHVGAIHRHPGRLDVCSGGDAVTDRAAVMESPSGSLIFGIVTLRNSEPTHEAIRYADFTINFYFMGKSTEYRYVPVRPEFSDAPLVKLTRGLSLLHQYRGASLPLDLAALRSLAGFKAATLNVARMAVGETAACFVEFNNMAGRLGLFCCRDGAMHAQWEAADGSKRRLHGPWDSPEVGAHIWLTEIALSALGLQHDAATICYASHNAPWFEQNPGRLVVEVNAMRQKYGDRAKLVRNGDELSWRYTVHESGREFPVRIVYPASYPATHPEIFSELPMPSSPHQFPGRRFCWTNGEQWSPARSTAAICIVAAHRWIGAILVCLSKGHWPQGANH